MFIKTLKLIYFLMIFLKFFLILPVNSSFFNKTLAILCILSLLELNVLHNFQLHSLNFESQYQLFV